MKSRKWFRRRNKAAWRLMHRRLEPKEIADMISPDFWEAWCKLEKEEGFTL